MILISIISFPAVIYDLDLNPFWVILIWNWETRKSNHKSLTAEMRTKKRQRNEDKTRMRGQAQPDGRPAI